MIAYILIFRDTFCKYLTVDRIDSVTVLKIKACFESLSYVAVLPYAHFGICYSETAVINIGIVPKTYHTVGQISFLLRADRDNTNSAMCKTRHGPWRKLRCFPGYISYFVRKNVLSFWDSLILSAAIESGCNVLYSEDLNARQIVEGIKIVNPFLM